MKKAIVNLCMVLAVMAVVTAKEAAASKAVSLLTAQPDVKKYFLQEGRRPAFVFDEQFKDNSRQWPEDHWSSQSGRIPGDLWHELKMSRGTYYMKTGTGMSITKAMDIDTFKDFIIEARLRVTSPSKVGKADNFYNRVGIVWNGIGNERHVRRYFTFVINPYTSQFSYRVRRNISVMEDGDWKKSDAINKKGENVLTVMVRDSNLYLFINGVQVYRYVSWATKQQRLAYDEDEIGKQVGFAVGWQMQVDAKSLLVLQPAGRQDVSANPVQVYRTIKEGMEKDADAGSLVRKGTAVIDMRTGLMWWGKGYRAYQQLYPAKEYLSWGTADLWVKRLNMQKTEGYDDWRLPTIEEYATIFMKGTAGKLGYLQPIDGRYRCAWSSQTVNSDAYCFDFEVGVKRQVPQSPKANSLVDALVVRSSDLDLGKLLMEGKTAEDLSPNQVQIFDRVAAAYKADLDDAGEALFSTLTDQAAGTMFTSGYTRIIARRKLPLKLSGKILLAVSPEYKNDPAFWYEAAHMAVLANHPALVLTAVKQWQRTATAPEFKEEILDQAVLFEAIAYMLLNREDKAYTALLMRLGLNKNILLPSYLNTAGTAMLKDKTRLATVIGIDEALLIGEHRIPKAQAFYNIETGQLVRPVKSLPQIMTEKIEKPPGKIEQEQQPRQTKGATVLD